MLADALDYPTAGDAGPRSVLTGGLLVAVRYGALFGAFLFYPVGELPYASRGVAAAFLLAALAVEFPLRGYRVRALRAVARDPDADAPSFRPVGSLLRDGAAGLLVYAVYLLPAAALFLLAAGGNATAALENPQAVTGAVARNVAGLAALFSLLYLVGASYVLPAAVTNFAHEGRARAAFRRRVLGGAFSEDYAVAWVASVAFQAVTYPVAVALSSVLVGPFAVFFVAVVTRYLWGYGYGRALGLEPPAPTPDAGTDEPRPEESGFVFGDDREDDPDDATAPEFER